MRKSTSAALVACVAAASVAVALLPGAAAAARPAPPMTFVLRGTVVQYIAPSGSTVGSLSLRVRQGSSGARRLVGELVTVAVEPGDPSIALLTGLAQGSERTLVVQASSAASVLKGGGALIGVTAPNPAPAPANARPGKPPAPTGPDPSAKPKDGDHPDADPGKQGDGGGGTQGQHDGHSDSSPGSGGGSGQGNR